MEQITDSAKLAAVTLDIIEHEEERWYQCRYFGNGWRDLNSSLFDVNTCTYTFPVEDAREVLDRPHQCDSTACVAGWVGILSAPVGTRICSNDTIKFPDGKSQFIDTYSQRQLELTRGQGQYLFSAYRSREQVMCALRDIASGHPEDVPTEAG